MKSHRPELAPGPATRHSAEPVVPAGIDAVGLFDPDLFDLQDAVGNAELAARLFQPPAEGEDAGVEAPPGLRSERPSRA